MSTNWHQCLLFYSLPQVIDMKQLPGLPCDIKLSCISTINNIDKMWYVVVNIWRSHGICQSSYQFHFDLFSSKVWMSIIATPQFSSHSNPRKRQRNLLYILTAVIELTAPVCDHSVCINNHLECCNFLWHRCEFHFVFMGISVFKAERARTETGSKQT